MTLEAARLIRGFRGLLLAVLGLSGLVAAVLLVVWASAVPRQQTESVRLVAHTLEVIGSTDELETHVALMAADARSFMINRRDDSRQRFVASLGQIGVDVATLRAATRDNPTQQAALERLQPFLTARMSRLQYLVDQLRQGNEEGLAADIKSLAGRLLQDSIFAATGAIKAEERRLLAKREASAQRAGQRGVAALITYAIIVAVTALLAIGLLAGRRRERSHREELTRVNANLERRVATRTAELAASVARQRSYFDHSPAGSIVLRAAGDGQFRCEDLNPASEAILGLSRAAVIGRTLQEAGPVAFAQSLEPLLQSCAADGAGMQSSFTGEVGGMQRVLDINVAPLHGTAEDGPSVLVCAHDVTHMRALQGQVQLHVEREAEAAEREAALFHNSPDILFVARVEEADERPVFIYEVFSPALERLTHLRAIDLIGRRPEECLPASCAEITAAEFRRCLHLLGAVSYTVAMDGPLGRHDFEVSVSPVRHPTTGRVGHIVGAQRDVTERNRLEVALRHAQKMEAIGRLASGVAHDFNNILQGVTGGLELVLDDVPEAGVAHKFATMALGSAKRGSTLTHHLLSFARKQMLQPRAVALLSFLTELQTLLARTLGQNIAVETEVDADCPAVKVDPGQLETALLNLAINASHAMPTGGKLHIAGRCSTAGQEWVVVTVSDTGLGMDEATLAQAVEPFFTTKGLGGTGLGLSMVQGFCEQSGGRFAITSVVGVGTTIELHLPAEAAPAPVAIALAPAPSGLARILLADDDPNILVTIGAFMTRAGFEIVRASSGDEALALLATGQRFQVIVSDYAMPGVNGSDLIAQARASQPDLPAILMTGFVEAGEAAALPPGTLTLFKPFRREDLLRALQTAMDNAGRDGNPAAPTTLEVA